MAKVGVKQTKKQTKKDLPQKSKASCTLEFGLFVHLQTDQNRIKC